MEPSLSQILESIIFVSEQPVTLKFVQDTFRKSASQEKDAQAAKNGKKEKGESAKEDLG